MAKTLVEFENSTFIWKPRHAYVGHDDTLCLRGKRYMDGESIQKLALSNS